MKVESYLFFTGRCAEAVEFYRTALGAKVGDLFRYKDSPDPHSAEMCGPGMEEKIMYCSFQIDETTIMASDSKASGEQDFKGFSLSIATKTVQETEKLFAALSVGGKVQMPLTKTFFSEKFGMVADQFGVSWTILVESPR